LRSGGFLAQRFNRRTALEPTTKLAYKALHPPLRKTAVSSRPSVFRVCKLLSLLSSRVIVCRVVRCVFYFFEGSGNFLKTIFLGWLCKLFDKALVRALAFEALAMCLQIGWLK